MTADEIAKALLYQLPVIDHTPMVDDIEYKTVTAVEYSHNKETGGFLVSVEMESSTRKDSFTTTRAIYVSLKEPCEQLPTPSITVPKRIIEAFKEDIPVTIKTDDFSGEWEGISRIIITPDYKNESFVFDCVFENKYEYHRVPAKHVKVKSKSQRINYKAIMKLFSEMCPMLPKPQQLTENRKTAIRSAVKDGVDFNILFQKVADSLFLTTKCEACRFDWILKPTNRAKILEGNYDNPVESERAESSYDLAELELIK